MKIFIDLGAFEGDTIALALKKYKDLDIVYVFEPLEENFKKCKERYGAMPSIVLNNAAADIADGESPLYLGKDHGSLGGTLCKDKTTSYQDRTTMARTVDFSRFLKEHVAADDDVILKIDIEGKEYDLLEKMIKDATLRLVREIFCEWHHDRMALDDERHLRLIRRLRGSGFSLCGDNDLDEFTKIWDKQGLSLRLKKRKFFILSICKHALKKMNPVFYGWLRLHFLKKEPS
jgi:FkbM family methyltransferase